MWRYREEEKKRLGWKDHKSECRSAAALTKKKTEKNGIS
jgi:hypothetical protein